MKKIALLLIVTVLLGCNHSHHRASGKFTDTSQSGATLKTANDTLAKDDDTEPSYAEVKADLFASYNKIERIDTLIMDGKDSLQVRAKFYCLHDSSLVVPKLYNWGEKKDFVSNTFASKIVILNNRDTVFNKIIKKATFNNALEDQLKKYAILLSPHFAGYNESTKEFRFGYSISIPLTDVGVPVTLVINKNGKYHILDEYGKVK